MKIEASCIPSLLHTVCLSTIQTHTQTPRHLPVSVHNVNTSPYRDVDWAAVCCCTGTPWAGHTVSWLATLLELRQGGFCSSARQQRQSGAWLFGALKLQCPSAAQDPFGSPPNLRTVVGWQPTFRPRMCCCCFQTQGGYHARPFFELLMQRPFGVPDEEEASVW